MDRVFLTVAARLDHHSDFGTQPTFSAGIAYLHRETDTRLKSSVGTAFKAPVLFQLYGQSGLRLFRQSQAEAGEERRLRHRLRARKKTGIRQQKAYMIYEGVPLDPSKPAAPQGPGPADPPTFRDRLTRAVSVVEFRIPLASLGQAGGSAAPVQAKAGGSAAGSRKEP